MALIHSRKEKVHTLGAGIGGQSRDGIWLLDDDVSMLKALGRLMNSAGFIVEKFNDPATFLAKLQHAPCRVAVLDVWMPQMNGLEVQARLRQESPGTRIIFMTGREDPSVRQTALDAGAFAFLTKPFDDENLVRLVQEAEEAVAP
jgi:FixJ family two-component response regulator